MGYINNNQWTQNAEIYRQSDMYQTGELSEYFRAEIHIIQSCASVLPTAIFYKRLQEIFGLDFIHQVRLMFRFEDVINLSSAVNLLITIFSERSKICNISSESSIERDIIHILAASKTGLTISALQNRLHTRASFDSATHCRIFNEILAKVSTFKAPTLLSKGIYTLQKNYYQYIDPWYYGFKSNQRNDVYIFLHEMNLKDNSIDPDMTVLKDTCGYYVGSKLLNDLVIDPFFNILVKTSVFLARFRKSSKDLHDVLHLIHIALHMGFTGGVSFASTCTQSSKTIEHILLMLDKMIMSDDKFCHALIPLMKSIVSDIRVKTGLPRESSLPLEKTAIADVDSKTKASSRKKSMLEKIAVDQLKFMKTKEFIDVEENESMSDSRLPSGPCIICQEEMNGNEPSDMFGLISYTHISKTSSIDFKTFDSVRSSLDPLNLSNNAVTNGSHQTPVPELNPKHHISLASCGAYISLLNNS